MTGNVDWEAVPLPDVDDPDLAPYWEGTRVGELRMARCASCGANLWPPRAACPRCGALERTWHTVSQQGTLFTWTVVGHTPIEGFKGLLPYAVGIVEIDGSEGVRMVGRIPGSPDSLAIGAKMRAVFEPVDDRLTLVLWETESAS